MQKPEPTIITNSFTDEELYAWMQEKAAAARLLQSAVAEKAMLEESLNRVEGQIASLTAQATLDVSRPPYVTTAGVDVQDKGIEVEIHSWGPLDEWSPILAQRERERQVLFGRGPAKKAPAEGDTKEANKEADQGEVWTISIKENLFTFMRKINGELQEAYRPVEQDLAAIYAAAIIQGFEPPRQLKEKDGGFIAHQVHQRDSDSRPQRDHDDQDIPTD